MTFPGIRTSITPLIHALITHLFQNTLVEELLQFLVAVVDAELLKAVVFEIFWGKEKKERNKVYFNSFLKPVLIKPVEGNESSSKSKIFLWVCIMYNDTFENEFQTI